jgi:hypothetical protein
VTGVEPIGDVSSDLKAWQPDDAHRLGSAFERLDACERIGATILVVVFEDDHVAVVEGFRCHLAPVLPRYRGGEEA